MMKRKWAMAAMASLFLGLSTGWAQTAPNPRKHTRPPYTGPRKARQGPLKQRPRIQGPSETKPGVFRPAAPPSDHVGVR